MTPGKLGKGHLINERMKMKQTLILDTETFRDYFLAQFLNVETGNIRGFEMYPGHPLDRDTLRAVLKKYRIVSFNGNHYDMVIISLALTGADNATLKRASDAIIKTGLKFWHIERQFGFKIPTGIDHVDLFEVAPGVATGLKLYGGRMHSKRLQDLPLDVDSDVAPEQREVLRAYCANDLRTTLDLFRSLEPQIALRERMSEEYGMDLRSKSDAQIAETVIKSQVSKLVGRDIERPEVPAGSTFRYRVPEFIRFTTPVLQQLLVDIRASKFVVAESGKVLEPPALKTAIPIGNSKYRMGIGGLHSSETSVAHVADENTVIIDRDVAGYYPAIILTSQLAPENMGDAFLKVYGGIVERRLEAKHSGDKVTADSLKITVNGSFGKFGSKYSALYSPDLLIQTTVTGQLSLLMLIEMLETEGIAVVSANTDGVVIACPKAKEERTQDIIATWEIITGFETEEVRYTAVYSRDVNNYIALKEGGGVKLKGAYAPAGLMKNPTNEICVRAVIDYLAHGKPIEETILESTDITKFITVRTAKGGAADQSGNYLGRVVRWYRSTQVDGPITYKVNGYKVAGSDNGRALMELCDQMPGDVDYLWYIDEANEILTHIGAKP